MKYFHFFVNLPEDPQPHCIGPSCECWCEPMLQDHYIKKLQESVKYIFHGDLFRHFYDENGNELVDLAIDLEDDADEEQEG